MGNRTLGSLASPSALSPSQHSQEKESCVSDGVFSCTLNRSRRSSVDTVAAELLPPADESAFSAQCNPKSTHR